MTREIDTDLSPIFDVATRLHSTFYVGPFRNPINNGTLDYYSNADRAIILKSSVR